MGKGLGASSSDIPPVETTPVAPVNPPVSESGEQVAQAAKTEKDKLKKAFGSNKTIIAGGNGLGSSGASAANGQKNTLG